MDPRRSFLNLREWRNYKDYLLGMAVTAAFAMALIGIGFVLTFLGSLAFRR
jgi:hypothetical protein